MKNIKREILRLIKKNRDYGRRGLAIYLAAITLSIVLTVAFGTSLIILYQLKNINEAGKSVVAFAAAESGAEWALTYVDTTNYDALCPDTDPEILDLDNGAFYIVTCELCGADLESICFRSEGNYKETQRTIKIQR